MGAPLTGLQNISPLSHPFYYRWAFFGVSVSLPKKENPLDKVSFTHGAVNEFPYWLYFRIVVLGS